MIKLSEGYLIEKLEVNTLYIDPIPKFGRKETYLFKDTPYSMYILIVYKDNSKGLYQDSIPHTFWRYIPIPSTIEWIQKTYFSEVLMEDIL